MYPGPKKYKLIQVANLLDSLDSSLYLCRRKDRSFEVLKFEPNVIYIYKALFRQSVSLYGVLFCDDTQTD